MLAKWNVSWMSWFLGLVTGACLALTTMNMGWIG